jgi:glucosamine kinase
VSDRTFSIGVDGGASKTECILVDANGQIVARHLAAGSNPSAVGAEQARLIVSDALCALAANHRGNISRTLLCMAGNRPFWREFAADLTDFGDVTTADDSLPVLELATDGNPGLVLHAGTGSFVAARDLAGRIHYAGGLGWRFGDDGSGYDLGRRAIGRALLELQGWAPPSRLGPTVRDHAQLGHDAEVGAVTRYFYSEPATHQKIASLAPAILRLATEGDQMALTLILDSTRELLELSARVCAQLFPGVPADEVRAGVSGSILNHPIVQPILAARSPLALIPIKDAPIEGVRRLLRREAR